MSIFVGGRKQFEMTLPASSTVVNFYLTGPRGSAMIQHLEYDYPCDEITRTDSTHYVFTTDKMLTPGIYDVEWLTDFGSDGKMSFRVDPVVSQELDADVRA